MDNRALLKDNAIRFMEEYGILENFQIAAADHSQDSSKSSSPLILDFEIDLFLLFDCSNSLYEKVVETPTEGRRIFQEATSECLSDYLLNNRHSPIGCVQILLRCKFFSLLRDGNSLYAKSCRCLSYIQRYVLTSVMISRSDKSTTCVVTRCPNYKCPGHAGTYWTMEEITEILTLDNCKYCGKKCYEDAIGRGVVRKVIVKFTSVMAFNFHDDKTFHTSLTCSIREPLIEKLELGDMYDIWGRHESSVYEIWGLDRTSFYPPRKDIGLSSLPPSIRTLWTSIIETRTNDPWILARSLAHELGSNRYRKNAGLSLKMGLLLSLASLDDDRCAPILCVGPGIDIVEEDIMQYAANCADRNVPVTFPLHGNIATNDQQTWFHSGSLLMAKTGVCYVGDWERLKPTQKDDLMLALDDGYIVTGQKNVKSNENEKMEFLSSSLPLRTAVWTYWTYKKNYGQEQPAVLQNLVNLFGIPFLADVEESVTADAIHESLELLLNGGKTNPRKVPLDELIEYLRIVNGIAVTLSEEAVKLIKDYFLASREVRRDRFPSQSITFMTTLAKSHARLYLRKEVIYDDVVAIIYLYEESMCFLYGYSTSTPPPFRKRGIQEITENMKSFKIWLKDYLTSLAR